MWVQGMVVVAWMLFTGHSCHAYRAEQKRIVKAILDRMR